MLEGNTADPAAFTEIAGVVKHAFGLRRMVAGEVIGRYKVAKHFQVTVTCARPGRR